VSGWQYREGDVEAIRHFLQARDQHGLQKLIAGAMNNGGTQQEVTDAILLEVMKLSPRDRQWWVDH
jgi:hypothetical protein